MNKLKFLPLFCLSFLFFTFISCSDNEESTQVDEDSLIEGIWIFRDEVEEGYGFCLVLNSDKTGMIIDDVFDKEKEVRYLRYTYDSKSMILTITENGEWPYEMDIYRLTSNQLITIDVDGELFTFTRYNGSIKDLEILLNMKL